jgi:hypothetical protein
LVSGRDSGELGGIVSSRRDSGGLGGIVVSGRDSGGLGGIVASGRGLGGGIVASRRVSAGTGGVIDGSRRDSTGLRGGIEGFRRVGAFVGCGTRLLGCILRSNGCKAFLFLDFVGIDIHSLFFVMLVETPLLSTLANCYRSSSGTHSHLEKTYKIHTIQFDMIPCVDTL